MDIRPEITARLNEITSTRKILHRIPEISFEERETHDYIYSELEKLAPDTLETIADTGLKAVFLAPGASRATAFRADIDALPVSEATGLDYASEHPGVMHACGHDGHMTVALETARLVAENRDRLSESVVFLFQPAEESGAGAKLMIDCGALENPHIDRVYGLHLFPGLTEGRIGVKPGPLMASGLSIDIILRGRGAHGAKPHLGCDAVVAAAQLITMLQTLVSRRTDPFESAVLTVGRITGGVARNIIADEVKLECTLRTFSDEMTEMMTGAIKDMLRAVEEGLKVSAEYREVMCGYPSVINDRDLAEEYRSIAGDAAAEAEVVCISEDFSFYQRKTKGLFVFLGIGDTTPLHSNTLKFDDKALLPAIEMNMRLLGL